MNTTRRQNLLAAAVDEVLAGRKFAPAVATHPVPTVDETKKQKD